MIHFKKILASNLNSTLKALFQLVYNFLPYAEGTVKLQEHVRQLDFSHVKEHYYLLIEYLTVIQKLVSVGYSIKFHFLSNMAAQDCGDDGELYQSQLNRLTRYILEHGGENIPNTISNFRRNHNISAILAQIENERSGELAPQGTDGRGRESTVLEATHEEVPSTPVADANAVRQHIKSRGGKRTTDRAVDVETTPRRRSLRLRLKDHRTS